MVAHETLEESPNTGTPDFGQRLNKEDVATLLDQEYKIVENEEEKEEVKEEVKQEENQQEEETKQYEVQL